MESNQSFPHHAKNQSVLTLNMRLNVGHIRESLLNQLYARKKLEQTPFEDICNLASQLSDKIYTLENDNNRLNSELHSLHRILLAEGTDAAKELYNKLSNTTNVRHQANEAEKKQISELNESLNLLRKENQEQLKCIGDLRHELAEKDKICAELYTSNGDYCSKIQELTKTIDLVRDERLQLICINKALEKRNESLINERDSLYEQVLQFKRENADRLNAENEREQRVRSRRQLDTNLKEFNQNNPRLSEDLALKLAENASGDDEICDLTSPARIPKALKMFFDAHEGETCAINWFFTGNRRKDFLATGGGCDRKVKIWKLEENEAQLIGTYLGSNKSINSIDIEGDNLLATSNDYASRIWSINDKKLKVTLTGHSSKVLAAKFIGRPNIAASCSTDRTVKIWDTNSACNTRTYFAGSSCHDLIHFDNVVVTGHFDGFVRCWDLRRSSHEADKVGKLQNKITSLDLSPDGYQLICSLRDNTVKMLDIRTMEVLKTYFADDFKICSDTSRARFSHDCRYIGCGSNDGNLYIWDAHSCKLEKTLSGTGSAMMACCWSPDGTRVATIDKGKRVSIWH